MSDGYDIAQTAICFLCQFKGKKVSDSYGKDRKCIEITIKLACYRELDGILRRYRRNAQKTDEIDFTDYKALPMDPVNYYEYEQTNYDKYDELVETLKLSELEFAILNCYMNGMVKSEVMAELGIGRGTLYHRKASIRRRYYDCFGVL